MQSPVFAASDTVSIEFFSGTLAGLGRTVKRTNICKISFRLQDWILLRVCVAVFMYKIVKFVR